MRERNIKEVEKRAERVDRPSINGLRDKLTVEGLDPNFHHCWVNDYNVSEFQRCGYNFVEKAGSIGETSVNDGSNPGSRISRPVGNGVTAFLMRIPLEWHKEDMQELAERVNEIESSIKGAGRTSGMYGHISIDRK